MTEPLRDRNININLERTEVDARGYKGRIEFYGKTGSYPGYDKLKFETWKFTDIDASVKDGALMKIESGGRTPVELVLADKTFSEVPLKGDLVFLHVDSQGNISAYHFDSQREKDKSFLFEVSKGEYYCWLALSQEGQAEALEYEEPGFTDQDLELIHSGTEQAEKLPKEIWEMIHQLETGDIKNAAIPIIELSDI